MPFYLVPTLYTLIELLVFNGSLIHILGSYFSSEFGISTQVSQRSQTLSSRIWALFLFLLLKYAFCSFPCPVNPSSLLSVAQAVCFCSRNPQYPPYHYPMGLDWSIPVCHQWPPVPSPHLCASAPQACAQYLGYDEAPSHIGSYATASYPASNLLLPLLQNFLEFSPTYTSNLSFTVHCRRLSSFRPLFIEKVVAFPSSSCDNQIGLQTLSCALGGIKSQPVENHCPRPPSSHAVITSHGT